ncbi:MAG: carbonic anhydrase, partial [Flavobacteriales bacterium]
MKKKIEEDNIELIKSYERLLDGNRKWSMSRKFEDPLFFKKMVEGQTPDYLWIGCSDSRVPANEITGMQSGQIFVHRNIANMVVHTDINLLSVLEYAIQVLHIKHIIVCGHYGCGGVKAALQNVKLGLIDNWLRHVQDVIRNHE